mmetsp:Transcript_4573/g.7407  ORF Transcript_4573/g.7407 Transcript_4573/m.7407 type:complete len:229 (+) Transcript_4573:332-1018(+)
MNGCSTSVAGTPLYSSSSLTVTLRPVKVRRCERRLARTTIATTADASKRPKSPKVIGVSAMRWINVWPFFSSPACSMANLAAGATVPQGLAGATVPQGLAGATVPAGVVVIVAAGVVVYVAAGVVVTVAAGVVVNVAAGVVVTVATGATVPQGEAATGVVVTVVAGATVPQGLAGVVVVVMTGATVPQGLAGVVVVVMTGATVPQGLAGAGVGTGPAVAHGLGSKVVL